MPLLAILHFAWVLPLIAPILLIWLIWLAFQRVRRRLVS